jgi:hypothetical protein
VQSRRAAQRAAYLRDTDGKLHGKPTNGVGSRYLLTGLATCARCDGTLTVRSRTHGNRRLELWACRTFIEKGASKCANRAQVRVTDADAAILAALEADLLRDEVVEAAVQAAVAEIQMPGNVETRRAALTARRQALEGEEQNLTAAIAAGGQLTALVGAVKTRQREREQVTAELARLDGLTKTARADRAPSRRSFGRAFRSGAPCWAGGRRSPARLSGSSCSGGWCSRPRSSRTGPWCSCSRGRRR